MSTDQNLFSVERHGSNVNQGVVQTEEARQIAEVQAMAVIANKFPRNKVKAFTAIMEECTRYTFAQQALYTYPRGGQQISGPSIRTAECIARHWGNLDFGIKELSQSEGISEMMAYCWDLETNTRSSQNFAIKHERHTRAGAKPLTDPRDIYELTANQGARRLRARILAIIPGDLIEAVVDRVKITLAEGPKGVTREERIKKLLIAFNAYGVTQDDIEKYAECKAAALSPDQLAEFQGIYKAIKDNHKTPGDYFVSHQALKVTTAKDAAKAIAGATNPAELKRVGEAMPDEVWQEVQEQYRAKEHELKG